MRMGEIRALTWEGVDLFRKTVTVFRSKNGERRTILINSLVLDVPKRIAKVRSVKSDYMFPSDTDTLLDDSHLRRAFRGAMKLCRIENFHFHALRHTFPTRLVQSGTDLHKVQCLLGHKSSIMTQRSAHHYSENLREGSAISREVPSGKHRGHKFSTHGTNGRAGIGDEWCKLLKNLVGRVGGEPKAR